MKTIEVTVTAHDMRSTFGNIVDYVVTEAASLIEGWTYYDVISYNQDIFGYRTWEIVLEREDGDKIANVYIQYFGHDEMPDDEIIAKAIIVHS